MKDFTVKPKRLKKGDTIALVSPASPVSSPDKISNSIDYLEAQGFKVICSTNINKSNAYLAGSDEERCDDINSAFANPEVKAIFCLRGGYGSGRILNKINYNLVLKYPKVFIGYSDITALHLALSYKCNFVSFSGPMPAVDFQADIDSFTENYFWDFMLKKNFWNSQSINIDNKLTFMTEGTAEGVLSGGNLTVLTSLIGTKYFPDMKGKLLFLEEVGEAPYRIDRMLNQLALSGVLKNLKGIILGGFTECIKPKSMKQSFTLIEIFQQYFTKYNIPVILDFPHGHIKQMVTLAMGVKVRISSLTNSFSYLEDPFN